MYNLTVGLKLKKGNYIDEECIKYLSDICCYLIGDEKNKFINCKNCSNNNISKIKLSCGRSSLISNNCDNKCIIKENFMVGKDEIKLFVKSIHYEVVNKLVQELFSLESIHIAQYEFDIYGMELISLDRVNEERRKAKVIDEPEKAYKINLHEDEIENVVYNV